MATMGEIGAGAGMATMRENELEQGWQPSTKKETAEVRPLPEEGVNMQIPSLLVRLFFRFHQEKGGCQV